MDPSFTCKIPFDQDHPVTAREILVSKTGLAREKIAEALAKGAVWLSRRNRKSRIRNGSVLLKPGDTLEINYDPRVLSLVPPLPRLIADRRDYTVWLSLRVSLPRARLTAITARCSGWRKCILRASGRSFSCTGSTARQQA